MLATLGADTSLFDLCKVVEFCTGKITVEVKACHVIFIFICATDKVVDALQGIVVKHRAVVGDAHRADESCHKTAIISDCCRVHVTAKIVGQFCFVDVVVTAEEKHHVFVVLVLLIDHCFAGVFCFNAEECTDFFNGLLARGCHLFKCL